ncbi:peptidoglycan editing factor PgeF [Hyphomonas sp. NPDC076900]|uniref:peptidoglycan editing factor PgeF n=1 Tax=unclassified Hyphomonas TaxID=2630699 RepID=UPI003D015D96
MSPPLTPAPLLSGISGLSHGFFGRRGGVSGGIYDSLHGGGRESNAAGNIYSSLNAGEGSGDDPRNIAENRARIGAAIGARWLLSCYQVHSPDVVRVTAPWDERPKADAMVTDRPGLGLCILSADCTPVLFADPDAGIIGAAHAGWKGAIAGVLARTLDEMEALGAKRARIRAAIGPTIQQASYEVGPEFRDQFLSQDSASEDLFIPGKGDRFHFDLPGFCQRQLTSAGAGEVFNLGHDTCAMEEMYFSNRRRNLRGEPDYGRNASAIVLLP